MQTGIIDRIEFAIDIGDGDSFAFHMKFPDRSRGDLVRLRSPHRRHLCLSSPLRSVSLWFVR
jgi:hypothetical protein